MIETGQDQALSDVEVLLFRVGYMSYAVDAGQVARVGRASEDAFALPSLGPLDSGDRALFFQNTDGGLGQLRVDSVVGVRTVPVAHLRRMPAGVAADPYTLGIWLDGERTVLLIDLKEAHKFHHKP